jgi:CheY-like chemotaxis protein
LCRSLKRFGYQAVPACNGEEAFRLFSESLESADQSQDDSAQLAAVVTDYLMPRIDGADLIRKMKALRPDFPVVLVTGEAPDAVILQLAALPEVITLMKPFRPEALKEGLKSVLHELLPEGRADLRKSIRVESSISCSFIEEDSQQVESCFASVRNLGFGGCYLQVQSPVLTQGQVIRFFLQGLERYVLTGRVAWSSAHGMGIALIQSSPQTELFYKKFVLNKLKQKGVGIMGVNSASGAAERV